MNYYGKTDIGKKRDENQDNFYISGLNDRLKLFVVADGMGGYNGGKAASDLAIRSIVEYIENDFDKIKHEKEEIRKLIKSAILYANFIIYEKSKEQTELEGMGTTIDVVLIYSGKIYIGHIGDSRVYRIRKNIVRQLTNDHSYVENLIKDGTITREESYSHPKKNMLIKALGCTSYVEPDIMVKEFLKGDTLIMATDGLTNMLKDKDIFKIVEENQHDIEKACNSLIELSNNSGGYDNITVVLISNN